MKFKNYFFVLIICLSGCAGISVDSDFDRGVDFSGWKTYAWGSNQQPKTGDARLDNSLTDSRIRNAVDKTLAAMGYQKIEGGAPDFLVVYRASIEGKLDVTTIDPPMVTPTVYRGVVTTSSSAFDWYYGGKTFVSQYEEGTLLVDFVNPETQRLMWRGSAKATVMEKASPEKREARINEGVQKILSQFPPKT